MKRFLYWIIIIIAVFAIQGTWKLVLNEYEQGRICPQIMGIPACYIVLVSFVSALILHLLSNTKARKFYFISVGIVTLMALTGTIGQLSGWVECPKTASGIPMCFISLGICLSLLGAKLA